MKYLFSIIFVSNIFSLKLPMRPNYVTPATKITKFTSNVIPKEIIGDYAYNKLEKYNKKDIDKIYITDTLSKPMPNVSFDLIIYNTTDIVRLNAYSLDKILVDIQDKLKTLGVLIIAVPEQEYISKSYFHILTNPTELWNYNLVSVEIDEQFISCRKGSSMLFKERALLNMAKEEIIANTAEISDNYNVSDIKPGFIVLKTGDENIDVVINFLGFFLQYTILFNFFSFGLMIFLQTFF